MPYVNSNVTIPFTIFNFGFDRLSKKLYVARFTKLFIKNVFNYIDVENEKKMGRPSFRITSMLILVIFSYYNDKFTGSEIEEQCLVNKIYEYLGDGIKPAERTIQDFVNKHEKLIAKVFRKTVEIAKIMNFTQFKHIAIDGTIVKANNSNYNVLKLEDMSMMLDILKNKLNKQDRIEKGYELSKRASRFLKKKLKRRDKIAVLEVLKEKLELSKQSSIAIYDQDARWMLNKKGRIEESYNIQLAGDYESKMIVSVDVTNKPTDHHQLPVQIINIEDYIGQTPVIISADTGYYTEESINRVNENIILLIPTKKQTKAASKKLNSNPYHKDHFVYDFEKDVFICPEGKELPLKNTKIERNEEGERIKTKRTYHTNQCKKCPKKKECIPPKATKRIIVDTGSKRLKKIEKIMETPEAKEEFKKRMPTAESLFGVLKQHDQLNTIYVRGIGKVKNRVMLKAIAYNMKRLANIVEEKHMQEKIFNTFGLC